MPASAILTAAIATLLLTALSTPSLAVQEYTAAQLIAGVKAAKPEGGIYARLRMTHSAQGADKPETLQVQVKRRIASEGKSEHLYQLLFPAARKGEGVLLKIDGGQFTGSVYAPAAGIKSLSLSDRSLGLFGTALSIDDVIAEFLDWPSQTLKGTENLGNIPCHVIESNAPGTSKSTARRVLSWIDSKRFVTQKIEIYSNAGMPLKTVITEKVLRNKTGYYLPVTFTVTDHGTGARTTVEGIRSDSGLSFADSTFAPEALQTLTTTP